MPSPFASPRRGPWRPLAAADPPAVRPATQPALLLPGTMTDAAVRSQIGHHALDALLTRDCKDSSLTNVRTTLRTTTKVMSEDARAHHRSMVLAAAVPRRTVLPRRPGPRHRADQGDRLRPGHVPGRGGPGRRARPVARPAGWASRGRSWRCARTTTRCWPSTSPTTWRCTARSWTSRARSSPGAACRPRTAPGTPPSTRWPTCAVSSSRPRRVRCSASGVASPGVVDEHGTVVEAPNRGWFDVPLAALLSASLGLAGPRGERRRRRVPGRAHLRRRRR